MTQLTILVSVTSWCGDAMVVCLCSHKFLSTLITLRACARDKTISLSICLICRRCRCRHENRQISRSRHLCGSDRILRKMEENPMSDSWEGFTSPNPWVTHGIDLCHFCHLNHGTHWIAIDFCGLLPTGEYLFVIIDAYSWFPEVVVHSTSARARSDKKLQKWKKVPWVTHGKDLRHQTHEWLMGLIYVTFPMSHSWEGFTSLLNGVNSPKDNLLKFIYMGMIYVLFIKE